MSRPASAPTTGPADELLSPEEYRLLAGPALKAAAEVAASRGDPDLFHDMASMLALLAMVNTLIRCYQAEMPAAAGRAAVLESAPVAICALVFTRSGLAPDEVRDCLAALPRAYQVLLTAGALGPQDAYVEQAFTALEAGDKLRAERLLLQAAHAIVSVVDRWEEQRPKRLI